MYTNETTIDVRYAETDMMGVVYHANYLIWMEVSRTAFVKSLGLDYGEMEAAGYVSPVINVNANYKKPARYGETITAKVWVDFYDGLKTTYGYEFYKPDGELAFEGTSTNLVVKREGFRPISMRRVFPDWHAKYDSIKKAE